MNAFIIDISIIFLFVLIVYRALRRGFLGSILGIIVWIASSVFAASCNGYFAAWAYDSFFASRVVNEISSRIGETEGIEGAVSMLSSVLDSIPQFVISAAESVGISLNSLVSDAQISGIDSASIAAELAEKIVQPLIVAGLQVIFFIILLLVSAAVLKAIADLIERIAKLPVLKQTNKLLGACFGVIKGIAVVFVVCFILSYFAKFSDNASMQELVSSSKIVTTVCQSTLTEKII